MKADRSQLVSKQRLAAFQPGESIVFSDLIHWVTHKKIQSFNPDSSRVIARRFFPDENRRKMIIDRVLGLAEDEARRLLKEVLAEFSFRHRDIEEIFSRHFAMVEPLVAAERTRP